MEARVPEPLERIPRQRGANKAVFLAVPVRHSLAQVGQQYLARAFFQGFSAQRLLFQAAVPEC